VYLRSKQVRVTTFMGAKPPFSKIIRL
jgi:hypothetical protein